MVKPAGSRPQEVIERSGRAGAGRPLDQIVSVRFHPPLLRAARLHAESAGVTSLILQDPPSARVKFLVLVMLVLVSWFLMFGVAVLIFWLALEIASLLPLVKKAK